MSRMSPSDLAGARCCVRPEYSGIPAEDLEQVVEQSLSGLPGDTTEDFFKTLGSLGKTVGGTLQKAAPGILQGATQGASIGGPWGALIGAGAGLASGALSQPGRPSVTRSPVPGVAPAGIPTAPALPTGQSAAATLLGLFKNPAVQQSLLSQVLGSAGGQEVRTPAGASIPRGAINNLLSQLLANATEGLEESESISEQSYLQGESGEYLVDPASPEQQAALVLSHLRSAGRATSSESDEYAETVEWMESDEWVESDEGSETVEFY
jgi:hypothetical protein